MLPEKLNNVDGDTKILETQCEPIIGLTIDSSPETMGVSTFLDEAGNCAEVPATTSSHYTVLDTADVQSIKDYLSRPRMIFSGDITTGVGGVTGLDITTSGVIRDALTTTHWNRLKGAVGIRATLRFTVVVAATPFHQGILTLNFQYATHGQTFPNYTRGAFLPYARNVPHVTLDVSETTMASLDLPFISHLEYFPVDVNNDRTMNYGTVILTKQTNFRLASGQNAPEYSLYLSLHDIEVIGAVPYTISGVTLQAGGSSGGVSGISKIHDEMKKSGLISKTLEASANVARVVSKFPPLSVYGGAADWFLRSASKAAAAFGYSRPLDENKPTRINRLTYAGDSQVDMPFQGYATTPFQTNKLAVNSTMGCTDDDEMTFDYVLTKPSIIYRGQMSDTDDAGTAIYGSQVCLESFWYRDKELGGGVPTGNIQMPNNTTGTKNAILPSTLLYVANNFRYWRGNLKFRITFSKSKMHGGRVQFTFVPWTLVPVSGFKLGNSILAPEVSPGFVQPLGLSTVFDLRDGSLFEFVVPYVSTDPYMTVDGTIGSISMVVVNSLRSPGIAASTVDFLVEVACEPGFELAVFAPATLSPLQPAGPTDVVYQAGRTVKIVDDASQNIIGERFNSLKQLAMVPAYATNDIADATTTAVPMTPWFKPNAIITTAPLDVSASAFALWAASPSMRVAIMYSYANGSTHYQLTRDGGSSTNFTANAVTWPVSGGATYAQPSGLWNKNQNASSSTVMLETSENSRWSVPTFSRYSRVPVAPSFAAFGGYQANLTSPVTYDSAYASNKVDLRIRNSSGGTRRICVAKSAGDDARASQFIGPPPCAIYLATSVTSPVSTGIVPISNSAF